MDMTTATGETLAEIELSRRRERVRTSRRLLWFSGLAASVALAVVPPLIDTKYVYIQVGIVIGLVGTCVGLLIEQLIRGDQLSLELRAQLFAQTRQTTEALHHISTAAVAPVECRKLINRIADNWVRIDARDHVGVFEEIRAGRTEELVVVLTNLANGSVTVSIDGPYSLRARPFDDIVSYQAIAMGPLTFWNSAFGQRYLQTQRDAIDEHGTRIERIFVLDPPDWEPAEKIVRRQVEAGVDCIVLLRDWVPEIHEQHLLDQGVIFYRDGGKLLMQPIATRYRQRADQERLCVVPSEIAAAEFSINAIRAYGVRVSRDTPWPAMDRSD